MKLLKLIREESDASLTSLAVLAILSALANALVLVIVNVAAEHASEEQTSLRYLLFFLLAISIFVLAQRSIIVTATHEVEGIIHKIRVSLVDKIRHADLVPLERIGRSLIYASINKDTMTLSQAATAIVVGAQSGILAFFTLLYIAFLSTTAFVISVFFISIAAWIYIKQTGRLNQELREAMMLENKLYDSLTDMLEGFKEVRMSMARSDDLFADFMRVSTEASQKKMKAQSSIANCFIFSQTIFYMLVGSMVFIVPRFGFLLQSVSETYPDVVIKTATSVLFLTGPVSMLVGSIPIFVSANSAAESIDRLDQSLADAASADVEQELLNQDFEEIRFEGVSFRHIDQNAKDMFVLGPVDLTIRRGEILFITGGNGSGKSTLIKLLVGLYYPDEGTIWIDRVKIGPENYEAFRKIFSAIFSDYHLFKRLYGIDYSNSKRIEDLFRLMELEDKTRIMDGEFKTIDLSGGQRKRIALMVSLLEDKPVFVFDEWAADQDPIFRRKFYREILKQMKKQGKTVVAVTHDDRYFKTADRRLQIEEGHFVHEAGRPDQKQR